MISAKARKLLSGMAASTVVLARGFAHVQQGPRGHCPLEGVSLVRAVDRPMSGLWRTQVLVRILVGARALVMPILASANTSSGPDTSRSWTPGSARIAIVRVGVSRI